jgi:hypothetical protein
MKYPFRSALGVLIASACLLHTSAAIAQAPIAAEIAKLGAELTPLGAEKAGNADGSIGVWAPLTTPPAGYQADKQHVHPFPGDKPKFVITKANLDQHKALMSKGQIELFNRYPEYQMRIFETRRTAAFPERIYEMTRKNATTAVLVDNGAGVSGVAEGIPFPLPKNGQQLIWNHKLKYKGVGVRRYNNFATPTATGQYTLVRLREEILGLYWKQGASLTEIDNILSYFFQAVEAPPRLAGNILLVHETLNQTQRPRQAWLYNPGQRRVRKAPQVAYDNPATAADGQSFNDMTDMFNGNLDRFDFKLVGKRELYVPYNAYEAHSADTKVADLVQPGHINPAKLRYEKHRMWVVDATLKSGVRHANSRRTFYLDEDSYQILLIEHYATGGQLWRYSEAHPIVYYQVPLLWTTLEVHHDLLNGRYIAYGLDNQDEPYDFKQTRTSSDYTPNALRNRGTR